VRYIKTSFEATKYWGFGGGFVFSAGVEGGYIKGLGQQVRLTDRFYLGEPEMRGFGIRGVGPRVRRVQYNVTDPAMPSLVPGKDGYIDDALGGNAYYKGRLELELPLGNGARELGLRPSLFMDVGAVFGLKKPTLSDGCTIRGNTPTNCTFLTRPSTDSKGRQLYYVLPTTDPNFRGETTTIANANRVPDQQISPFQEQFFGDTPKPRLSVGIGVNWNSPFGPFRIDVAKVLVKAKGDDTKLITFNVGTQF